jgi:predicted MFS family arabinose efflux permease
MTVSQQEATSGELVAQRNRVPSMAAYAWVILTVVWLASVAASLNQFKVPPLIPVLMASLQLDLSRAGMLMSVFALAGLVLALPAGIIVQKLGPRFAGGIAVGCLVIGSAWGALAASAGALLTSRVLEGVGFGLIGVVGPAAITLWFPSEKRGIPMGIWATWVPVGSVVMLNLAPALATAAGWRAVWWAGSGIALIALLLYGLFMRAPAPSDDRRDEQLHRAGGTSSTFGAALGNRSIWLLGLEFACFNIVLIGLMTFFPTFLIEVRGYTLAAAAFITSLATLITLASAPLSGWLSDRIGSRRLLLAVPFFIFAAMMVFPFQATGWTLYAFVVLLGIFAGATPTATFAAAPEVMASPHLAGIGLGVVSLGMNLGIGLGPLLFGTLVERMGWVSAGYWLIPVSLIGFAASWLVRVR